MWGESGPSLEICQCWRGLGHAQPPHAPVFPPYRLCFICMEPICKTNFPSLNHFFASYFSLCLYLDIFRQSWFYNLDFFPSSSFFYFSLLFRKMISQQLFLISQQLFSPSIRFDCFTWPFRQQLLRRPIMDPMNDCGSFLFKWTRFVILFSNKLYLVLYNKVASVRTSSRVDKLNYRLNCDAKQRSKKSAVTINQSKENNTDPW